VKIRGQLGTLLSLGHETRGVPEGQTQKTAADREAIELRLS
jgi:hypothetical protein